MAVFVKAVDLGSFAGAATALDLSGPMIGKHIRSLEERLGARLINRTTRRQSLTEFGRAYYERCRLILTEADAADALAADHLSELRGRLRVAMPVHFGQRCVLPILIEFVRQHPALKLDLSFNDRIVDLLEGDFDLSIRTGALADSAGIIARNVARQTMIVCASPSYVERHGEPDSPESLTRHTAVIYRRSGPVLPWLFPRAGQGSMEVTPIAGHFFDDLNAIAEAAVAGMGLAWLPYWIVREQIASGALVRVLPSELPYLYDCYALWPKGPYTPLKVRLAVAALAAGLPRLVMQAQT